MALLVHALEQGFLYGLMALGVYISFRVLRFPDLSVDGTFPLGASLAASLIVSGWSPFAASIAAAGAGAVACAFTGTLSSRFRVQGLLAGVLTMIMLYSLNLRIMGRPNLPLLGRPSAVSATANWLPIPSGWAVLAAAGLAAVAAKLLLDLFFRTELGLTLRAAGGNPRLVQAYGADPKNMVVLGLAVSNGLVALSGALVAQYSGFADVNMGVGTIVAGLAAVIVGEMILRPRSVAWATGAALLGSCLYRGAILVALRYGGALGFTPSDLKLLTALVVLAALVAPVVRGKLKREEA